MFFKRKEHRSVRFSRCENARVAIVISEHAVPERCRGVPCTFSTLTHFSHTFSTMTVESFHDDVRHFRPFMLILFHANTRSHMVCAVLHNFRKTKNPQ